ncbi:hypothetical protein CBM2586_B10503 [Cupriavidus phytorum]|uniref:Uncharacterized protein n=1 Tax=Cupriavidus taiwanensis TaxID=164546 RepID=A0A375C9T3_9BURK|nr:hypothetical protein CBM2586_B10503 [Cupriavidus taiwanensis]
MGAACRLGGRCTDDFVAVRRPCFREGNSLNSEYFRYVEYSL